MSDDEQREQDELDSGRIGDGPTLAAKDRYVEVAFTWQGKPVTVEHGTASGYAAEMILGRTPCVECSMAKSQAREAWRKAHIAGKPASWSYGRTLVQRSLAILEARHQTELEIIMEDLVRADEAAQRVLAAAGEDGGTT